MKKLEFFQLHRRPNPQIFQRHCRHSQLRPDYRITRRAPHGLIHISSLTDDFYVFERGAARWQTFANTISVGDKLRVFVARVDDLKGRSTSRSHRPQKDRKQAAVRNVPQRMLKICPTPALGNKDKEKMALW